MKITPLIRRIRRKMRNDFIKYAEKCLFIRQKDGKIAHFRLNQAQKHIHTCLEDQLKAQKQVRALIVKGRQQGCSTYVEGRFFWKVTHRQGVRAFILAHLEDASRNLAGIARRFYKNCPPIMRPVLTVSNRKMMTFGHLDSGYKVGTAKSSGVGRSDTIQYFHGSEVAYWTNAREHIAGILQSIPDGHDTEVILESTSDGPQGAFFEMCKAAQNGDSQYQLIFVPWFWQEEYQSKCPDYFFPNADEVAYQKEYDLSRGQIYWRRNKIAELGGIWQFRREYPATLEEAFHSDIKGALWTRQMIEDNRTAAADCPEFVRIVVAIDPAVSNTAGSDETGIITAALGADGDAYILRDDSGKYTPAGWAKKAVGLYTQFNADRIVIEVNQGGDMALHTLKTCDARVAIKKLHASRGKWTRAEPVAALDEQGRVHHVGSFIRLEDQMCGFKPGSSKYSPDRVDARVWAVTELLLGDQAPKPQVWSF